MAEENHEELSLANLGRGAAEDLFQHELARVMTNIADPNTQPEATREVVIRLVFKPSEDRSTAPVTVICTSKLAAVSPFKTRVFIGIEDGRVVAKERDPKQLQLVDAAGRRIVEMGGGKKS